MVNLRILSEESIHVLDKALVHLEFQIKDKLKLSGLQHEERQSLEKELSLIYQIYTHLDNSLNKIQD